MQINNKQEEVNPVKNKKGAGLLLGFSLFLAQAGAVAAAALRCFERIQATTFSTYFFVEQPISGDSTNCLICDWHDFSPVIRIRPAAWATS